jgi:hypothetical protein
MFTTAHLMGGLGNQMFQMANVIGQARRLKLDYGFFLQSEIPLQGKQPSSYISNIFRNIPFVSFAPGNLMRLYQSDIQGRNIDSTLLNNHVEFFGYYQSEVFFQDSAEYIRRVFAPSDSFIQDAYKEFDFLDSETVSVHIRRGDYLRFPGIHPSVDISYVQEALECHGHYDNLIVFSDDPEWAKKNFDFPRMYVISIEDYQSLWLMSLCKHNIIANSSFSWWASYLNFNKNCKVYAPSRWYGPDGDQNFLQIYRNDMVRIPVLYKDGALFARL